MSALRPIPLPCDGRAADRQVRADDAAAALRDGTAQRRTTFEVFARRLPDGRRYGVVAGTGRFLEALTRVQVRRRRTGVADRLPRPGHAGLPGRLPVQRRHRRLRRGRAVLSRARPCCRCTARSPNAWCSRRWRCRSSTTTPRSRRPPPAWSARPTGRPLIEMGSRRTHEQAAVAAARAAYIAGFAGSSNLEAQRRYGVPALGTSAHAFTMLHTTAGRDESPTTGSRRRSAPRSTRWGSAPRCWSTPTTSPPGSPTPSPSPGPQLGAVRIDSGDLGVLARQVRAQLDELGATGDPDRGVR